jgi:YD repeat-containing protein
VGASGFSYAKPDAVTQIANGLSTTTHTYDNNGNVTQKTVDGTRLQTYVYDYANRLTALGVGGATTTCTYDWAGNRVSQTGTTTTYLRLIFESDTDPSERMPANAAFPREVERIATMTAPITNLEVRFVAPK